MIKNYKDGSVLMTGNDMVNHLEKMINHRNNYDIDCSFCINDFDLDNECEDCSIHDSDNSCSCHLNPPCWKCENSHFEVSEYLINYKHYKNNGKWRWECFKSDKKTFNKLEKLEKKGNVLSVETLQTSEIVIYLGLDNGDHEEMKICNRKNFKNKVEIMISDFD